ncbi:tyrosine-type recombinase/integrase [Koleobacter methoxysyntrophicus]|uniref:tyrosine-type recombinase/integrase n=1 Tax=Koleobacter methoxysyntrophicus TaxID=2751313 RepID=UPI001F511FC6|nr:tyrosine-type recombinase/integrase [Koleobacter methoxysyntrophicus]
MKLQTVYSIIPEFEQYLKEKDSRPKTIEAYLADLKKFIKWYQETAGELPEAASVGPLDIAEFKRHLQNKGYKPATVNRILQSLKIFFSWAEEVGVAKDNPAGSIKMIPVVKSAPRSLESKERQALIRAVYRAGKERDIAIVTLLMHTGLRVSELCALTLDDIKLRERSGYLTVRSGKGNKYREVPLNLTARKALKNWLAVRGDDPGPLFPGKTGRAMSIRNIEYMIEKYAYNARLEDITPHVLRHTFCKALVDAGESLDRVAELAGHSDLNVTARYTRPTRRDLQKSVDKLAWE